MSAPVVWTDAMHAILRREWPAGTSARAIADMIDASHGVVTGEAKRLGLAARPRRHMRRRGEIEWTEPLIARLTELWASGLSTRLIADEMRRFLPTIRKNSVTGKAQRLGLPQRGSPIKRKPVVAAAPVARPKALPLPPGAHTLPPLPSELSGDTQ